MKYVFRLRYHGGYCDLHEPSPTWYRDIAVAGSHTLEQLSAVIVDVLDWDPFHLYYFDIREKRYEDLGEGDYFVDNYSERKCVSCAVCVETIGFVEGDECTYVFDYGDMQTFSLTVLQVNETTADLPALVSYMGANLVQHPTEAEELASQAKTPRLTLRSLPRRDLSRVRFVHDSDTRVLEEWRKSNDRRRWAKAVAILDNLNSTRAEIAAKVEKSVTFVITWAAKYNREGLDALDLPRKKRNDRRTAAAEVKAKRLIAILHEKPRDFDINRSNWSQVSLARAYEMRHNESISRSTIRRLLKNAGYRWAKARRVLSSPDPEYREKVELLLKTLHNLKQEELFFFVDELGPLRVKRYGGRAYVPRGATTTVPQVQSHKGAITLAAALSATTNQVTWLYQDSKDTTAMIALVELLFNQHHNAKRLFLTWDAASWHESNELLSWLDAFNTETYTSRGPVIELVPLPRSSQFLNVLEAVFSGMKRAVIHHSDYAFWSSIMISSARLMTTSN